MKYNKGFASLAVLLIVLGVLAVGGVAYFAGKSSTPKNEVSDNSNYFPTTEQNYTPPTTDNNPPQQQTPPPQAQQQQTSQQQNPPPCKPSITLISPNGGEIYQAGQQVTIKWKTTSCFSTLYPKVAIDLVAGNRDQAVTPEQHIIANNTGSVVWTVPTAQLSAYNQDYSAGPYTLTNFNNQAQFRFLINGYPYIGRSEGPLDYSDNRFTINSNQQVSCAPNDPPSITVINPIAGASYTVGQNVNLSWTSCNVQNIWLGLGSGGKDFGEITYPNPVPASQGSYQWTVTNPAQAFTGSSTNTYFIGFESQSPNVLVKSGNFTVHP